MILVLLIFSLTYSIFWLYRSYQIGIKRQLNLVKDWMGKPLQNPAKNRIALASVYMISGLAQVAATFALLVTKAPLKSWWGLVALWQCYVIAHILISWRAKKNVS